MNIHKHVKKGTHIYLLCLYLHASYNVRGENVIETR
jgi:hypothetical protein